MTSEVNHRHTLHSLRIRILESAWPTNRMMIWSQWTWTVGSSWGRTPYQLQISMNFNQSTKSIHKRVVVEQCRELIKFRLRSSCIIIRVYFSHLKALHQVSSPYPSHHLKTGSRCWEPTKRKNVNSSKPKMHCLRVRMKGIWWGRRTWFLKRKRAKCKRDSWKQRSS